MPDVSPYVQINGCDFEDTLLVHKILIPTVWKCAHFAGIEDSKVAFLSMKREISVCAPSCLVKAGSKDKTL